jgi:CRISPR-associated endonuclease/helicase Cas3
MMLTLDDFDAYFRAVHALNGEETPPFPWQRALLNRVAERGWPSLLDLPTGSGKTAAIDVAVFHLALEAGRGVDRRAPIRILFTVDRRIIVDAAYARAVKIAEHLKRAADGEDCPDVLRRVACALRKLSGPRADPLVAVRLRGGVPHDTDWARSPAQPLVAVSTVDQVGSRLLFRGYGVSRRMWPVHAGLVGADSLWLLDEVHLARPLDETLRAIGEGHAEDGFLAAVPRAVPFTAVRLSATPDARESDEHPKLGEPFRLGDEDRGDRVLGVRLTAAKPATLVLDRGDAVDAIVRQVEAMLASGCGPRLAVVVNTVRTARAAFMRLRRLLADRAACSLLIGRVREIDRPAVIDEVRDLLAAPNRAEPPMPRIVVATQTIEAGADFDVDTLVTEIAPIDSLRQRFGRLNRLGRPIEATAAILVPDRSEKERWATAETIYGGAVRETARWLQEIAVKNVVDFGIDAMDVTLAGCDPEFIGRLIAPKLSAPIMLPSYADDWATTSPPSSTTPAPDLFLHGRRTLRDVQLVWRADVPIPTSREDQNAASSWMESAMAIAPPASPEVVEVPIHHARRLIEIGYFGRQIRRIDAPDNEPIADISVVTEEDDDVSRRSFCRVPRCWRYRDSRVPADRYRWVAFSDVRPGDLLIVPTTYGGYDQYGWADDEVAEVPDAGLQANWEQRGRVAIRVAPDTLRNARRFASAGSDRSEDDHLPPLAAIWARIVARVTKADGDAERIVTALRDMGDLPPNWYDALDALDGARPSFQTYDPNGDPSFGFGLFARAPRAAHSRAISTQPSVSGDDDSSNTGTTVTLEEHSRHVAAIASQFAEQLGLEPGLRAVVAAAGLWHDSGKIDPRFQADLRGEAALYALGLAGDDPRPPLAKSTRPFDPRAPRATPRGFRHEALSVALARMHPVIAEMPTEHRDLCLWLIGTHHGFGRPFFPPTAADDDGELSVTIDGTTMTAQRTEMPIAIDSGWLELRLRVLRRWGAWETARFEALVRLADHAASAAEADGTINQVVKETAGGV